MKEKSALSPRNMDEIQFEKILKFKGKIDNNLSLVSSFSQLFAPIFVCQLVFIFMISI
jgi:hypothetical protein